MISRLTTSPFSAASRSMMSTIVSRPRVQVASMVHQAFRETFASVPQLSPASPVVPAVKTATARQVTLSVAPLHAFVDFERMDSFSLQSVLGNTGVAPLEFVVADMFDTLQTPTPQIAPATEESDVINEEGGMLAVKRTFQPSLKKRKRTHGFLKRNNTADGRAIMGRRREKGRARTTV